MMKIYRAMLPLSRRIQLLLLSVLTYVGSATAVVAPQGRINLLNPQTNADLVAVLGLAVAAVSLALNAYLRWQTLRLAQETLAHTKAMAALAQQRQDAPVPGVPVVPDAPPDAS